MPVYMSHTRDSDCRGSEAHANFLIYNLGINVRTVYPFWQLCLFILGAQGWSEIEK